MHAPVRARLGALLVPLALALAPHPAAAQAPDGGPSQAMRAAEVHFAAGRWAEAAAAFAAVVEREPDNSMAWFRLGAAHQELGNWTEAKAALDKAVGPPATTQGAHIRLARVAMGQGDRAEALAQLRLLDATGFPNAQYLRQLPDLAPLAGSPEFEAITASMDARRYPCRSSEAAQAFDFWIGTWDVTANGQHAGVNTITEMLGECVLLEEWEGASGTSGKSMNFYDASRDHWRQIWVADNGNVLDYTGHFRDGAMRFAGVTVDSTGAETLQKLTFVPESPDTVRQIFEASSDGGQTWQVTWEGIYVRRK